MFKLDYYGYRYYTLIQEVPGTNTLILGKKHVYYTLIQWHFDFRQDVEILHSDPK